MMQLIRYLKPYVLSVVVIVALLFAQAMTDLALPDYMSNIVNVGLQQGGIERAVPEKGRGPFFGKLELLLTDEGVSRLRSAYVTSPESGLLELRLDLSEAELDALEADLTPALMVMMAVDKAAAGESGSAGMPGFEALPAGMSLWDALAQMPADQRAVLQDQLAEQVAKQTAGLSGAVQRQAAIAAIRAMYEDAGIDVSALQSRYIWRMGGWMLLIALASVLFAIAVGFFSARVAAGLAHDLRKGIFTKVEQFSNAEFDKFSTASLITRTTNDIQQIQMTLVFLLRVLFFAPMMAIGGILKIASGDVSMIWIIGLAIVALLTLLGSVFAVAMPRFKIIQKLIDRLNLVTREILTGLLVVRAFNTQPQMQAKFARANEELTKTNLFVNRVMVLMMPFMMLIMNFTTLLIVWVGAQRIDAGVMQVGDMMAFMQYSMTIIFSFLMVSFVFVMMPRASVAAQRVVEVIDMDLSIVEPEQPEQLSTPVQGRIEFKNVSFRYPGADDPVLSGISFVADPGQTTAFIGSTGSGKSTLINLIPRFYDVSEGDILLDGVDIRRLSQKDLRSVIGYVPQKGILFTGDIASNIRYGRENASDEDIAVAARTAQAMEFVASSPEGFATVVAQGGSNVSGGQKQRLAIARALATRAPVYIFDDSFSALDYRTDAALRRALHDETAASTVLIVAQRIGTIRTADQIVVLNEGRIVGIGKHQELLRSCQVYAEIAASQLSAEELAK
ncbi:MAG: ABC transporter ATP-binding protein [Clostridia bacterium]|nr:ABC transporter ATP-binding protein [Clostridia bacterium]